MNHLYHSYVSHNRRVMWETQCHTQLPFRDGLQNPLMVMNWGIVYKIGFTTEENGDIMTHIYHISWNIIPTIWSFVRNKMGKNGDPTCPKLVPYFHRNPSCTSREELSSEYIICVFFLSSERQCFPWFAIKPQLGVAIVEVLLLPKHSLGMSKHAYVYTCIYIYVYTYIYIHM